MKKQGKFMGYVDKALDFTKDHEREIMLGTAIAGAVVTAITGFRAGMKASKVLEEQREKMDALKADYEAEDIGMTEEEFKDRKRDLTAETVKRMAPIVATPAIALTGTIISVVGGYQAASKEIAVLSSLYSMSKDKFLEYQDKVKEEIGAKKAQEIKDNVNSEKIKINPPKASDITDTGKGTTYVYDPKSGRYFYSSPEAVKSAANIINKRMMDEYYISLNEFYEELGLKDVELGDDIGFNIDDGLIDIDHLFTTTLSDGDLPTLVLDYEISAKYTEHKGKMFR